MQVSFVVLHKQQQQQQQNKSIFVYQMEYCMTSGTVSFDVGPVLCTLSHVKLHLSSEKTLYKLSVEIEVAASSRLARGINAHKGKPQKLATVNKSHFDY